MADLMAEGQSFEPAVPFVLPVSCDRCIDERLEVPRLKRTKFDEVYVRAGPSHK